MKKNNALLWIVFVAVVAFTNPAHSQVSSELRIDPLLLVSLKECRNITNNLRNGLFPGWDFRKTPVLFYRPNVQELLINYPHKPKGFSLYSGFNPLGDDTIYVRNDTTLLPYDDQNTSTEVESIRVLVVADPFSSMRNQLQDIVERPKEWASTWLKNWQFIPNPYNKLQVILHEAFHVYQNEKAPDKGANETVVAQYPPLDPENNALYVLEGSILKDALFAQESKARLEKIKEFVAVRSYRQSRLDSSFVEYENLNEYSEGLAKYVEYKFMKIGEAIEPTTEMSFHQGFKGYRGILSKKFRVAMDNMVNIVAVNDDRFGNKFGSGPLRFKLYDLGACQGLLLDYTMPRWKERIFQPTAFLTDLLKESVALKADELKRYLDLAKEEYNYDEAFRNKVDCEKEGKKKIDEKVSSILKTEKTLVKILYGGVTKNARVARFTPFGVTQVSKQSAIYEMVPALIIFKKGVMLDFRQAIPVLVDQEKQQIIFSIDTTPSKLIPDSQNRLDIAEFSLTTPMDIQHEANTVHIRLK
ncbi:MAG: hypothetical protein HW374_706 [Bacteroidetes bacterium]|nr:hypothetical protein [Bacteroidota bacterium]